MVGYRFHPTDEELINHYLKNKNLSNTSLVEEAINEINIDSYDPLELPSLSKIKSEDHVWYFFTRETTIRRRRNTKSGFWKRTGSDREIKDRRGNKIGLKKTLVYHERGARNHLHWVMQEYHSKFLSHPNPESYVVCKIKYKPETYGNKEIIITQPEVKHQVIEENFDDLFENVLSDPLSKLEDLCLWDFSDEKIFNMLPQTPYLITQDNEDLFSDQEFILQEDYNKYRPKRPVKGIIIDDFSDSDAESIFATSYPGISSPEDSTGCSNSDYSCLSSNFFKDLQTPSSAP